MSIAKALAGEANILILDRACPLGSSTDAEIEVCSSARVAP